MTASAAGSIEAPGKNVAAKSGLNRSILDQGWGMFGAMLRYKLGERGHR
jgi:putative transposase